jgi:hypothetical protein
MPNELEPPVPTRQRTAKGSASPPGINVTSGNSSPVNINAPYAYAEQGGTANANINSPAVKDEDARTPWYRSLLFWTVVIAVGTFLLVLLALK